LAPCDEKSPRTARHPPGTCAAPARHLRGTRPAPARHPPGTCAAPARTAVIMVQRKLTDDQAGDHPLELRDHRPDHDHGAL